MERLFYHLFKGVLLMTAEDKFDLLTSENQEQVIRLIESLKENQSERQSSPDSQK